jgi:regulator of ribonuclease activity A
VINGYVRDTHITETIPVGLVALGTCPRKSFEQNDGERDVTLRFGGVTFTPGDWVMADRDGVIVADDATVEALQEKLF